MRARNAFFRQHKRNSTGYASLVKWADLDHNGRFVRGGVCEMLEHMATLVSKPAQDPDIALVCDRLAEERLTPGSIKKLDGRDAFIWLLPYTYSVDGGLSDTKLRALYIDYDVFSDVLDGFNSDSGLTPAEKRLICQLAIGQSLRDAATADAVSFETKRSQLKSISLKLNCTSQNDVIRLALGQLVHLLSLSGIEADHAKVAEDFVAEHGPPDAQLSVHRLSDGRLFRVIECGPKAGTPILLFHSMMFALFLRNAAPHLHTHGFRLMMPIRPGYLELSTGRTQSTDHHVDQFVQDVADYLEMKGIHRIKTVGHSLGCLVLLRFAARHPNLTETVSLVSFLKMNTWQGKNGMYRRFGMSLSRLVATPGVFRLLAREFRRRYHSIDAAKTVIRKLFKESPPDVIAFEGDGQRPSSYAAFHESYKFSYVGVAEDFTIFYMRWLDNVASETSLPLQFIQGTDDNATPVEVVRETLNPARGDRLDEIPGAGQFCFGSHPETVWHHVAHWCPA
ncbi:MAG: alpha/beta hydrolase [Pseudomonadota bacterium]